MTTRIFVMFGFLFSLATLLAACTPKPPPVVVSDPRFAFPVDGSVGFYSYTTPLPSKNPEDVAVRIAPVEFYAPPIAENFRGLTKPIYRKSDAEIVEPLLLAGSLHDADISSTPEEHALLGFFAVSIKAYPKPGLRGVERGQSAHESGVAYLDIDNDDIHQIRAAINWMRREAAQYGADAVINLRIHRNDWGTTTSVGILPNNHLIAQAEVVAFLD